MQTRREREPLLLLAARSPIDQLPLGNAGWPDVPLPLFAGEPRRLVEFRARGLPRRRPPRLLHSVPLQREVEESLPASHLPRALCRLHAHPRALRPRDVSVPLLRSAAVLVCHPLTRRDGAAHFRQASHRGAAAHHPLLHARLPRLRRVSVLPAFHVLRTDRGHGFPATGVLPLLGAHVREVPEDEPRCGSAELSEFMMIDQPDMRVSSGRDHETSGE